jgi:hypothetical protein
MILRNQCLSCTCEQSSHHGQSIVSALSGRALPPARMFGLIFCATFKPAPESTQSCPHKEGGLCMKLTLSSRRHLGMGASRNVYGPIRSNFWILQPMTTLSANVILHRMSYWGSDSFERPVHLSVLWAKHRQDYCVLGEVYGRFGSTCCLESYDLWNVSKLLPNYKKPHGWNMLWSWYTKKTPSILFHLAGSNVQ